MDIGLLKTFIEVKSTRSFGRAAENLFITQAAVSARIKQLEESLGVKLFIRQRNNLQLTSEGERLVPHAETMLMSWARAKQDVGLKAEAKTQLSIGTTAGLWAYTFQDRLASIVQDVPDIALRTEVHSADELLRMVLERSLDLVMLFDAPSLPELTTVPLGKLKLVMASTVQSVTAKGALQSNYIYVDWGTAFNIFHAKRYPEVAPSFHHTTMASIAEALMREMPASAYLPDTLIDQSSNKHLYQVTGAPAFSREVSVIYRSNNESDSLLKECIAHLSLKAGVTG